MDTYSMFLRTFGLALVVCTTLRSFGKPSCLSPHQAENITAQDDPEKNVETQNQIVLLSRFHKEDYIQKWLALHRTIAVLMSLVEGFLFMPMLVAPTGNLSAFIVDNVCPLAQLPAPRPYSSSFLIGTIILNVGSIIRVCISIALEFVASEHELITTGPFAVVRHPTHSSLIIAGIGTILIRLHGPLSFCGLFAMHPWIPGLIGAWMAIGIGCMYWLVFYRVNADENELKEAFGEEWETYCKKVRYKLIPGLI